MSIFPATDIISDVARAADPTRAKLATKRLEDFAIEKGAVVTAFSSFVRSSGNKSPPVIDNGAASGSRVDQLTPTQKFEALLLQGWLEDMLPKAGAGPFGTEAGADIWRSMMAEQISSQLARSDVMGLRKIIEHKNSALSSSTT